MCEVFKLPLVELTRKSALGGFQQPLLGLVLLCNMSWVRLDGSSPGLVRVARTMLDFEADTAGRLFIPRSLKLLHLCHWSRFLQQVLRLLL